MRKIIAALLIAVAVLLILGVAMFNATRPIPLPSLPNPNGYDDFMRAAHAINSDSHAAMDFNSSDLSKFLETNAEPLKQLHLGLTHSSAVPLDPWLNNSPTVMNDLSAAKRLAFLLVAEGRFAAQQGRVDDAITSYLDTIRFGNEISRGGLLIHRLVGIACEMIGFDELIKLQPKLTCVQADTIIKALENFDRTGVTWNEVMHGENIYVHHELRRTLNPLMLIVYWRTSGPSKKKAENKHNALIARFHLLETELALRCYQKEHNTAAENLSQLVPKYFQAVPADPFSRGPLVYKPDGTNWVIYSFGFAETNGVVKPVKLNLPE